MPQSIWTQSFTEMAKFYLAFYRDYKQVSGILGISESQLKQRNNKYWKIDTKSLWNNYNKEVLKNLIKKGLSYGEIARVFAVSENAIKIQVSKNNKFIYE